MKTTKADRKMIRKELIKKEAQAYKDGDCETQKDMETLIDYIDDVNNDGYVQGLIVTTVIFIGMQWVINRKS